MDTIAKAVMYNMCWVANSYEVFFLQTFLKIFFTAPWLLASVATEIHKMFIKVSSIVVMACRATT